MSLTYIFITIAVIISIIAVGWIFWKKSHKASTYGNVPLTSDEMSFLDENYENQRLAEMHEAGVI